MHQLHLFALVILSRCTCAICFGSDALIANQPFSAMVVEQIAANRKLDETSDARSFRQSHNLVYRYDIAPSSLLFSMNTNPDGFERDKVLRILDANTIKLQSKGVVTLWGVKTPIPGATNVQLPECLSYDPAYKIRQLLPINSPVLVKIVQETPNKMYAVLATEKYGATESAVVARGQSEILVVNRELVRTGFANVRASKAATTTTTNIMNSVPSLDDLKTLERAAAENGLGIFQQCSTREGPSNQKVATTIMAEFEPLEWTVETKWGADGGKQVLRRNNPEVSVPPQNPRDSKGCSDFETYEDALRWFEYYKPWYGDVAKLDRDGDGIPCPGLPHTTNREQYRMKVPSATRQN